MIELLIVDIASLFPAFADLRKVVCRALMCRCGSADIVRVSDIVSYIYFKQSNAVAFVAQFENIESRTASELGIEMQIYDLLLSNFEDEILDLWELEIGSRPIILPRPEEKSCKEFRQVCKCESAPWKSPLDSLLERM